MASSLIPGCQVMSDLLTIREKGVISTLLQPQHEVSSIHYSHFELKSVKSSSKIAISV